MSDKHIKNLKEYPHYIDNSICGEDLFEGHSHSKIAESICSLIENGENSNIIGLDGGWGTGKSNLISLVINKINAEFDKYHFFIYDAWGHQDDIQRRSILEELTIDLTTPINNERPILDSKKWETKLNQLLAKSREIKTKSIPSFSCGIILSFLAVVITPITTVISDKFINSNTWKILVVSIPVLAVLLCWLYFLTISMYKFYRKKGWIWAVKLATVKAFSIYSDKQKEDKSLETISEDLPSSRKFKAWMKDIDTDLKDNKLVIVFDNMDRLSRQKVQELWAAIHSFFSDKKYNNIRVIVPFDREHIISAFREEDNTISSPKSNESDKYYYGNDFINKTFNVVYRVSPPTMSNWKNYFFDRWYDAFGQKLDINDSVTQIYDILNIKKTPRDIIAFINEFVTIKRIFNEEGIPNKYIALFILRKDDISKEPERKILSLDYLQGLEFMFKDDEDLPKYISALYYQVPVSKALDLVYTDRIKKALDENNVEEINQISKLNIFYELLEKAIIGINNIENAVITLKECLKSQDLQSVWECIYHKININEDHVHEYQIILLGKINDKKDYAKKIVANLYDSIEFTPRGFYNDINKLCSFQEIDFFKLVSNKVVEPKFFVEFVDLAKEDYQKYKINCEQEKLVAYLNSKTIPELDALKVLPYINDKFHLEAFKDQLHNLIDSNISNITNIHILYNRLTEIERPITKILDDERIYTFFNGSTINDDFFYDLLCMRISRYNNFNSRYNSLFGTVLDNEENEFVEHIAKRIEHYTTFGDILLNMNNMNSKLLNSVARYLVRYKQGGSTANILAILQKYDIIKLNLNFDKTEILIGRLNGWSSYGKKSINATNIMTIPIEFFKDSTDVKCELTNQCNTIALQYLQSIPLDKWKTNILENSMEVELLLILKTKIQQCFDAFKELLVDYADGKNNELKKNICNDLISLAVLNKRSLLSTFNNVRDLFCSGSVIMTQELFDYYGEWLLRYSKLEAKESSLRTIFIPSIMDNTDNIKLMITYKEKLKMIFDNAGEENKDFKDKISSLLEMKYNSDTEFRSFAKLFGIELKEKSFIKNK